MHKILIILLKFYQHFVMEDKILRPVIPDSVLKASGQVDINTDHMVKDDKTRELKHILAVLNDLCPEQLGAKNEYDIVETITRNPLFETQLDANSELVIFRIIIYYVF